MALQCERSDPVCDVVDDDGCRRSSVVHGRQTVVALLVKHTEHTRGMRQDEKRFSHTAHRPVTRLQIRLGSQRRARGLHTPALSPPATQLMRHTLSQCARCLLSDLSRRVPYFELDHAVGQLYGLSEEGGSDGAFLVLEELTLHETQHQRRLAHRTVTQQHLRGEGTRESGAGQTTRDTAT